MTLYVIAPYIIQSMAYMADIQFTGAVITLHYWPNFRLDIPDAADLRQTQRETGRSGEDASMSLYGSFLV